MKISLFSHSLLAITFFTDSAFGENPSAALQVSSSDEEEPVDSSEEDRELFACEKEGETCKTGTLFCCPPLQCEGPDDLGICRFPQLCFTGSSLVDVEDEGPLPMTDVRIGDKVHVGNNVYEPIYSFGHYDTDRVAEYLKIETSQSTLEISSLHLVFSKSSDAFVPASSLRVGEILESGHKTGGEEQMVQSITPVQSRGVFAPFTPSGKIVVNDVVTSSYVTFRDQPTRTILGIPFSFHWMMHTVEFPHRAVCYYLGRCPHEQYDSEGVSTWLSPILTVVRVSMTKSETFKSMMLLLAMPILLAFAAVEAILVNGVALLMTFAVVGLVGFCLMSSSHGMKSKN